MAIETNAEKLAVDLGLSRLLDAQDPIATRNAIINFYVEAAEEIARERSALKWRFWERTLSVVTLTLIGKSSEKKVHRDLGLLHEVQTTDLDAGTKLLKIVNQALDTQVTKTDSPQVDRHVLANELAKVTGSPYDKLQQVNLSKPVARRISKKAQKLWREKLPSLNRA